MRLANESMSKKTLTHLLKPGEFRVWCRPNNVPGDFNVTTKPSKANCANCLTAMRTATTGRRSGFKVKHTTGRKTCWDYEPEENIL